MAEVKIQLGAGSNYLAGWLNFDRDVDLEKLPLPFPDNHADVVFIEHCLEHFTVRQALAILDDINRILKPGGTVRVCCPTLERLDVEHGRDIALGHGHLMIFSTQSLKDLLRIARFNDVQETPRKPCDCHYKVIGHEKDDKETARAEGRK